jgi:DNA-binding transcriptional regulator YbjK
MAVWCYFWSSMDELTLVAVEHDEPTDSEELEVFASSNSNFRWNEMYEDEDCGRG